MEDLLEQNKRQADNLVSVLQFKRDSWLTIIENDKKEWIKKLEDLAAEDTELVTKTMAIKIAELGNLRANIKTYAQEYEDSRISGIGPDLKLQDKLQNIKSKLEDMHEIEWKRTENMERLRLEFQLYYLQTTALLPNDLSIQPRSAEFSQGKIAEILIKSSEPMPANIAEFLIVEVQDIGSENILPISSDPIKRGSDAVTFQFLSNESGRHRVSVRLYGQQVNNSPLFLSVSPSVQGSQIDSTSASLRGLHIGPYVDEFNVSQLPEIKQEAIPHQAWSNGFTTAANNVAVVEEGAYCSSLANGGRSLDPGENSGRENGRWRESASEEEDNVFTGDTCDPAWLEARKRRRGFLDLTARMKESDLWVTGEQIFGDPNRRRGMLNAPIGACENQSNGDFVVCNTMDHRVEVWDRNGLSKGRLAEDVAWREPSAVLVVRTLNWEAQMEEMYAVKDENSIRLFLTSTGAFVRKTGNGQLKHAYGLAISDEGYLITWNDCDKRGTAKDGQGRLCKSEIVFFSPRTLHRIKKWTYPIKCDNGNGPREGSKVRFLDAWDGKIVLSDLGLDKIHVLSQSGEILFSFGERGKQPGQFTFVSGVAFDGHGNLLIGDAKNNRVQVFDNTFQYKGMVRVEQTDSSKIFLCVSSITLEESGRILAVSRAGHNASVLQM